MSPDLPTTAPRPSPSVVVRRHLFLVTAFVLLGAVGGWLYAASTPTTYTSTARVLVNPTVGNPFVPSATAVDHAAEHFGCAEQGAAEVDLDDPPDVVEIGFPEWALLGFDDGARVVRDQST